MRPRIASLLLLLLACAPLAAAAPASASQMVGSNARYISLKVGFLSGREVAVVSYASGGRWHHVLAWGATNARPYSTTYKQVSFALNYAGGYGSAFGTNAWKHVTNRCAPDTTLKAKLPLVVRACSMTANPHDHWALQSWQRTLPNAGLHPTTSLQRDYELHLSHWTGNPPVLWLKWGWAETGTSVRYDHLYGVMSFHGFRVYGHASTSIGNPTDSYGRNIYVDALNRTWTNDGAYTQAGGWVRFNGFLTHYPRGDFCASVYKTNLGVYRPGYRDATAYRATAMGPGVAPIVRWTGPPPGNYRDGYFPSSNFALAPVFPGMPAEQAGRAPWNTTVAFDLNTEQRKVAGSADSCYHVYGDYAGKS